MKKTAFLSRLLSITLIASCLALLGGCDNYQQVAQLPELGCPVYDAVQMQRIFRGAYGVDGMSRPLNDHGVPVDTNGYCLTSYPVTEVYNAPVAAPYQTVLFSRWHYSYFYNPAIVVAPIMPGLYIHPMGVMPGGRVMVQTTRPAMSTVTTRGATGVVRPGAVGNTTVTPGNNGIYRPGAVNPTVGAPVNSGTYRPGAMQQQSRTPAYVQPSAPGGGSSLFNRPQTIAPRSVMPSRPMGGVSSSFNRPSGGGGRRR